MNMELANRALYAAGMDAIKREDKSNPQKKELYEFCKSVYFATFLEALAEAAWTSGRKRKRLLKSRLPHADVGCRYAYDLPFDCARPLELLGKEYFVVEGRLLCTDAERAELLYVSNGKVLPPVAALKAPGIGERPDVVISSGGVDEIGYVPPDVEVNPGSPEDFLWGGEEDEREEAGEESEEGEQPEVPLPEDPEAGEDFPQCRPPEYEPKFWEYMEAMLAAKLAVKNTRHPGLHNVLLQKALLIKQDAINVTKSSAAGKRPSSPWWSDRLGWGEG